MTFLFVWYFNEVLSDIPTNTSLRAFEFFILSAFIDLLPENYIHSLNSFIR